MATTFQRARSEEQRALRRQAILDAAAAMLRQMPVSDLSLNELSRRVGLAKSNVLRYFDSREDVLLQLLADATREWLAELAAEVPSAVRRRASFNRRAEQLAAAIAGTLAERPMLCDLLSAQASVLEHNVSVDAIARHKLEVVSDTAALAEVVRAALPEFEEEQAWRYATAVWVVMAALWAYARPPEAVLVALATDERLARLPHLEFGAALADYLATLAVGLHNRATGSASRA